jgi:probable HAF family extracellular repeat protein
VKKVLLIVLFAVIVMPQFTHADSNPPNIVAKATADSCVFSLPSSQAMFYKAGGVGLAQVIADESTGCEWTAVSNVPWVSVSPEFGTGDGIIDFIVDFNSGSSDRTGTMTIGGHAFVVTQSARVGPGGEIVDLGTQGDDFSSATRVTPDGSSVIGYSVVGNYDITRGFLWQLTIGMLPLDGLGGTDTQPSAISADGRVIVGKSKTSSGVYHAIRWNVSINNLGHATIGMTDLGTLNGDQTAAIYVSADGSVISGNSYDSNLLHRRAFRWTQTTGIVDLGLLSASDSFSFVTGMSDDGSVTIGTSCGESYANCRAFRQTPATGMTTLDGYNYETYANDISSDGSVIVGQADLSNGTTHAILWTLATGFSDIGAPGGLYASASRVSSDGNVVAGVKETNTFSSGDLHYRSFRWTQSTGFSDLGSLGQAYSMVDKMTPDGKVIIGRSYQNVPWGDQTRGFRWSQATGMLSIGQWLANSGVSSGGFDIYDVYDVSANGNIAVGQLNGHAFIARVEVSCGDHLVKLDSSTYHSTVQSAYNNASTGQPLLIQAFEFSENLNFTRNIEAVLQGGYNCDFTMNSGYSKLNGSLTINGGTVAIENIIIK